ncbi:MAG: hypothetical protein ACRD0P_31305 [Stackebrandtia sp.]
MATIVTAPSPTVRALIAALATWDQHVRAGSFGTADAHLWRLANGPETWQVSAERTDVTVTYHATGSSGWLVATTGLDPAVLLSTLIALGCPEVAA